MWKKYILVYKTTAAPLCILPSRTQEGRFSPSHRVRVQNKREGNGSAALRSPTRSASHSDVRHEVLPLLPAKLLGHLLGRHHLGAVACPGLGK